MKRDPRVWFPLAFLAAGSLLTVAVLLLPKLARPRPTEQVQAAVPPSEWETAPLPAPGNRPDPPPGMKAMYLQSALRGSGLTFAHPDPTSGVCYIFDGPADLARLNDLRPEEEYADCWRGMLLCMADPPPLAPDGDHGSHAGDFYLFGDVAMMERVKPAAEAVHFGPYRGQGEGSANGGNPPAAARP